MGVEKYFNVNIPNHEAELASTVQNLTDVVARQLDIKSAETSLRDGMLRKFIDCLGSEHSKIPIQFNDYVTEYLSPLNTEGWAQFEMCIGYDVPEPDIINPGSGRWFQKIKRFANWKPAYDWEQINFSLFTDAVCMENYKRIVNPSAITSKHEIYIAIGGITSELCGVDCYEIAPDKAFTSDLGID